MEASVRRFSDTAGKWLSGLEVLNKTDIVPLIVAYSVLGSTTIDASDNFGTFPMKYLPLNVLFVFLLGISPAYAYLDPGTGSMIIQMTIAGILSIGFTMKLYWYRIKGGFNRMLGREVAESPESPVNPKDNKDKSG